MTVWLLRFIYNEVRGNYAVRKWLFVLAILIGWGITWLDSGANWDDTGITAGLIVISTGISRLFRSKACLVVGAGGRDLDSAGRRFHPARFWRGAGIGGSFHWRICWNVHPAHFTKSNLIRIITTEQYD